MTFLETSERTGGELLRVEVLLPPGFSMPEHVHPRQQERHEVLSGTLRGRVGGRERDYRQGEQAVGPPGLPHAWRNPSDREDLRMVSEHRPALHMELMLDGGSALTRELEANKASAPKQLLRAAILLDDTKDDFYFTGAPMRALMAVFVALAPVGRLLGLGTGYGEDGDQAAAVGSEGQQCLPSVTVVGGVAVAAFTIVFLVLRWRKRPRTG